MGTAFKIFEIIGTIAFAISGAVAGIHKKMDLFGVMILGLITAVGGGVIRDTVIGRTPPAAFQDPTCALISLAVSVAVFAAFYYLSRREFSPGLLYWMNMLLFVADSVGLSAFTVLGIEASVRFNGGSNGAVLLFVGVITGIGGGILRDVLSGSIPFVFRKHIYAMASLLGAAVMLVLRSHVSMEIAALFGAVTVMVIRTLAFWRKWNLPRIQTPDP